MEYLSDHLNLLEILYLPRYTWLFLNNDLHPYIYSEIHPNSTNEGNRRLIKYLTKSRNGILSWMDQTDFSNPSNNSTHFLTIYLFIYLVMYLYSISFFHYNFLQLNSVKLIMIFIPDVSLIWRIVLSIKKLVNIPNLLILKRKNYYITFCRLKPLKL